MCGIFGGVGRWSPDKLKILALLNEKRGADSWGLLNQDYIYKDTGPIGSALRVKKFEKIYHDKSPYLLGHTRLKTFGAITIENAHPFKKGSVIGAHNGQVYSTYEASEALDVEYADWNVDSELIFQALSTDPKKINDLEGYGAIWWIDYNEPTKLNLWRDGGPLSYARGDKAFYFSSDENHLKVLGYPVTEFKENIVYSLDINNLQIRKKDKMEFKTRTYTYQSKSKWDKKRGAWTNHQGKVWDFETQTYVDPDDDKFNPPLLPKPSKNVEIKTDEKPDTQCSLIHDLEPAEISDWYEEWPPSRFPRVQRGLSKILKGV